MSNIIKLEIVEKYNPYHDSKGRFTSAGNATSFTIGSKSGLEWDKKNVQRAIEREKQRTSAKPGFVPAKTIAEATDYAHNELGIENVRFGNMDVEIANQMNESIATHFEKFPELKDKIKFIGSSQEQNKLEVQNAKKIKYDECYDMYKKAGKSDEEAKALAEKKVAYFEASGYFNQRRVRGNTWAEASFGDYFDKHGISGIAVNEKYGSDLKLLQSSLDKAMASGFHPQGCNTIKSVVDHEMGHLVDGLIGATKDKVIRKTYNDIIKGADNDYVAGKAMGEALSKYSYHKYNSNSSKFGEFVAEAWSEYNNNPNCRPTAKQVGQRMEEIYSGRKM